MDTSHEILLQMSLSFMHETLLSMNYNQISQMFLMYDCQQFSESIITKSINLLLECNKNNPDKYFAII